MSLPFRDALHCDESFMGFVLRMSNANGFHGVHWLYALLGRDKLNRFKPEDGLYIANLFGADINKLSAAIARPRRINAISVNDIYGHRISRPYLLRSLRPQICPICISTAGYARSLWDFSIVCACPDHRCMLIDACPRCDKRLQWMRPSLYACNCGFIWARTKSQVLLKEESSIRTARILQNVLHENNGFPPNNPLDIALSALTLDVVMRLIWIFGIKSTISDVVSTGVSRKILRTNDANLFCERAFTRLVAVFSGSECSTGTFQDQIHMPSLFLLAKELNDKNDLKFMDLLLRRIFPKNGKKSTYLAFNQLSLF